MMSEGKRPIVDLPEKGKLSDEATRETFLKNQKLLHERLATPQSIQKLSNILEDLGNGYEMSEMNIFEKGEYTTILENGKGEIKKYYFEIPLMTVALNENKKMQGYFAEEIQKLKTEAERQFLVQEESFKIK